MSGFYISLDSDHNKTPNPASNTHDIRQSVRPIKVLDRNARYACALNSATTSMGWWNISIDLNNTDFHYSVDDVPFEVIADEGNYTFASLREEIHAGMLDNGHATLVGSDYEYEIDFMIDLATNYITCIISDPSYKVNWDTNMRTFFGFDAGVQEATARAQNEADPWSGISELQICCNLVAGQSIENGHPSDVLYTFPSNIYSPNEIIFLQPSSQIFIDLAERSAIDELHVWLKDQNGRILNLRGSPFSVSLYVQRL